MTRGKKSSAWWGWALLVLLILTGCPDREPVTLGFVGGLSGRVADLGMAGRNGVMLAIEEQNARGGIDGRMIDLIVRDDEQDPKVARRVVNELLGMNVEVIIGPMTSSMAMVMVPPVNESHALLMSPTVTTDDLTGKDDNFLRVMSDTREYATKNARYQFETLGLRKVAAIYDLGNRSYAESWLKDFAEEFAALGGSVTVVKQFRSGDDTSFSEVSQELLSPGPDGLVIVANSVDAALICQQVRKLAPELPIAMSEWASTERFVQMAGRAADGVLVAQFLNRNDASPAYREFLQKYRQRFGQEPGFAGVAGFDAARVVLDALEHRKGREPLRQVVLREGTFQGLQQPITIDRFGDANRKTFLTEIRDGQYVTIE